jgi:hypothetical protein
MNFKDRRVNGRMNFKDRRVNVRMNFKDSRGSVVTDVVILAAAVVFVVLPVFSAVVEKNLVNIKAQIVKDAIDMANLSAYNSLVVNSLSAAHVELDYDRALDAYCAVLAENLNLKEDLSPKDESVAEGRIIVEEFEIFAQGLPVKCPEGEIISRPAVHSVIKVPVRPTLYRQVILSALGKDCLELTVHVDTEIPLNR